ncbi:hypothetical protein GCM10023184_28840 [Flaviaesturariibacter amylovorans]|uniref:UspA domain-containing protein n=1 Tax=Flaviaesturariibacter amylovorans TaxID=1084520 RepID=A0ABP8H5C9_9BACT
MPTDFSANADKAFNYALGIAKSASAEILVLHVCSLPIPAYADEPEDLKLYNRKQVARLRERLEIYRNIAARDQIAISTLLVDGEVLDSIVSKSQQYNVDLIVMATSGAGSLKTFLFGTRTAAVIAASKIPIISVPATFTGGSPRKILIAMQERESVPLLAPVFQLGKLFDATVKSVIFSDNTDPVAVYLEHSREIERAAELMRTSYKIAHLAPEHIVGTGFTDTITDYIEGHNVDLLVMVTHAQGNVPHLLSFSNTREMALRSGIPLLSIHA